MNPCVLDGTQWELMIEFSDGISHLRLMTAMRTHTTLQFYRNCLELNQTMRMRKISMNKRMRKVVIVNFATTSQYLLGIESEFMMIDRRNEYGQ